MVLTALETRFRIDGEGPSVTVEVALRFKPPVASVVVKVDGGESSADVLPAHQTRALLVALERFDLDALVAECAAAEPGEDGMTVTARAFGSDARETGFEAWGPDREGTPAFYRLQVTVQQFARKARLSAEALEALDALAWNLGLTSSSTETPA